MSLNQNSLSFKKPFHVLSLRQKRRLVDKEFNSREKGSMPSCLYECDEKTVYENENSTPYSSEDELADLQIDDSCNTFSTNLLGNSDNEFRNSLLDPIFQKSTLTESIKKWSQQFNVSHTALSSLLKILHLHGHKELCVDARTLLNCPRNTSSKIVEVSGGHSTYFGIQNGLVRSLKKYYKTPPSSVKLNFNIDGLPLTKSSGSQFWPILCAVVDPDKYTEPFVVSIFHGYKKPVNVNDFLRSFVNEAKTICAEGIIIGSKNIAVQVNSIICDAPARAFVCGIKGHTGYFGCGKCIQEGDYVDNRIVFPEINAILRTDLSFKYRNHAEHHINTSILEELNIGMVSQIPLDYMHLICLGVMKRLLVFWTKGKIDVRIKNSQISSTVERCKNVAKTVPKEFARTPRSILDVDRWKATEFREFLLYTGIFVMKNVLSKVMFDHFLCLSISVRILADTEYSKKYITYAKDLLKHFVKKFGGIYGNQFLSYNVHNVVHICDDVETFGPLDQFSAFKFESFMYKLKLKLKTSSRPLHQIANRIAEESEMPIDHSMETFPKIHLKEDVIQCVELGKFHVTLKPYQNCFLLASKEIIVIENIFSKRGDIFIQGGIFVVKKSYFEIPCDSSIFDIYTVEKKALCNNNINYLISDIERKMFMIDLSSDEYLLAPLIL